MRFPKTFLGIDLILLILGPVLLYSGPVTPSVPGNLTTPLCQNSVKTVPNSDILLTQLTPITAAERVTSKRPKNNTRFGAYPGYGLGP